MTDLIAADVGIRQLHARFADATWRLDPVSFAECFAREGEWKIAGMHLHGRQEIETTFGKLLGIYRRVMLNTGQTIIDIGADGVTGRVPMMEFAQFADGTSAMSIGFYFDRYVEEDGRWRFAHRHWNFEYRGPTDLSGAFRDSPDYGPPPGMPGPDEPTYVRPQ